MRRSLPTCNPCLTTTIIASSLRRIGRGASFDCPVVSLSAWPDTPGKPGGLMLPHFDGGGVSLPQVSTARQNDTFIAALAGGGYVFLDTLSGAQLDRYGRHVGGLLHEFGGSHIVDTYGFANISTMERYSAAQAAGGVPASAFVSEPLCEDLGRAFLFWIRFCPAIRVVPLGPCCRVSAALGVDRGLTILSSILDPRPPTRHQPSVRCGKDESLVL